MVQNFSGCRQWQRRSSSASRSRANCLCPRSSSPKPKVSSTKKKERKILLNNFFFLFPSSFTSPLDGGRNISGNYFSLTMKEFSEAQSTQMWLLSGDGRLNERTAKTESILRQQQRPTLGLEQGEGSWKLAFRFVFVSENAIRVGGLSPQLRAS